MKMQITPSPELVKVREETRTILRNIIGPPGTSVALLDIPRHRNLGDSFIWAGTLQYLQDLQYPVLYESDHSQFDQSVLSALPEGTVVLLQGGGNFGDLYPEHHSFRESVIANNETRKIILLPQSIHFYASEELLRTARKYAEHRNLTLIARESRSLQEIQRSFPNNSVAFCHDLALGLEVNPFMPSTKHGQDTFFVVREDKESVTDSSSIRGARDWGNGGALNNLIWNYYRILGGAARRTNGSIGARLRPLVHFSNRRLLKLNLEAAVQDMAPASNVITDRLHAHVLATLLHIPNYFTDNSYGKIGAVHAATTHRLGYGFHVESFEEAINKVGSA